MRACLALVLSALAACSAGTTSTASSTAETACRDVSERVCAGLVACACRFDVRPYDAATCVAERTTACVTGLKSRVIPDLDAGRVKLDAAAVQACRRDVDALAATCRLADRRPLPPSCDGLFIDVAAIGETCRVSGGGLLFCADGAGLCSTGDPRRCEARPGAGAECGDDVCASGLACRDGKCGSAGKAGDPCVTNAACAAGLACVGSSCASPIVGADACERTDQCEQGFTCTGGHCTAAPAIGEECARAEACGAGRGCGRAPETRTCGARVEAGGLCDGDVCAGALVCDATTRECVTPPDEGVDCAETRACAEGYGCSDADHLCHRLPGVGEPCFMGERFCRDGLGCREATQTCEVGGGDGTACLLNPPEYVCAPGFGCNFGETSTCRPLAGAGTACETDRTCSATTYCGPEGECIARLGAGSKCPAGNECSPGLTCTRLAAGPTCVKTPIAGESCEFECADALVCRGGGGRCTAQFCLVP